MISASPSPSTSAAATNTPPRKVASYAKNWLMQGAVDAVEHLDVRPAASAGRGDDVEHAVAIHVTGRHPHPAGVALVVGKETEFLGAGRVVEHPDER